MSKPVRLNRSQRLRRFLEAGYLPEELPPPFVTHPLGRFRKSLAKDWASQQTFSKFRSRPEHFTIPRYGSVRRRLTIPNPINYFRLASTIASDWVVIRDYISQSKITEFRPIVDAEGPRSIFKLDFSIVSAREAEILGDFDHAFKTDITRFYQSIYTHSIAWALHGKAWVKANLHSTNFKAALGNRLDSELRKGQEDQSVGIPIGPDTSRILSEVIAIGLERELQPILKQLNRRCVRYVDDITIGFDDGESEDLIASALEAAMSHYELEINVSKTKTLGKKGSDSIGWIHELRACKVNSRYASAQRRDLERFFALSLYHAEANERDAVLKWAMRRARTFNIQAENVNYFFNSMSRLARKSPATLPILAQSLIESRSNGIGIPLQQVEKLILDMISIHAPIGHAFEVSWALFLSKGLRIQLKRSEIADVFALEISLCALLSMDLNSRGLIAGGIDESAWATYGSEDGLSSSMWLLAYEAARKRWWSDKRQDYVANHPLFGPMLQRGIYFYDEKRNVPRLRKELKDAKAQQIRTNIILNRWFEYL